MKVSDQPSELQAILGPVVATIGKYDGMHLGHQSILSSLRSAAAKLGLPSVVILSEPQPEEFFAPDKAPLRLMPFADKVDFLTTQGIDAVLRMNFDKAISSLTADEFIYSYLWRDLGLCHLVIGDDFKFGKNRAGDFSLLQRNGAELGFTVDAVEPCLAQGERVSSTLVRKYLEQGNCERVQKLLARPFMIRGIVQQGRRLGRQLGVPTANLALETREPVMRGVFIVEVELVDGSRNPAIANIGFKPTVTEVPEPSLEVHLLHFDGNLYGKVLKVHFINKIRDEKRFDGLEALRSQIQQDLTQAKTFFGLV
jgi:riboflavin kinase/FMN adenylyltransferase